MNWPSAKRARWTALSSVLLVALAVGAFWLRRQVESGGLETATQAWGVWWPAGLPQIAGDDRAALRLAGRLEAALQTPWRSAVPGSATAPLVAAPHPGPFVEEYAPIAAAIGEFDAVLSLTARRGEASTLGADAEAAERAASYRAAALFARGLANDSMKDLLVAAEILARQDGSKLEPAAACNRVALWEFLGLSYRARELNADCPLSTNPPLTFRADVWAGRRSSTSDLPAGELTVVTGLLDGRDVGGAQARVRRHTQAWRVYLEREGLEAWLSAAPVPAQRLETEERLRALAEIYSEATSNRAPAAWVGELARLQEGDLSRVILGLRSWLDGARDLAEFRAQEARVRLSAASQELKPLVPSLDLHVRMDRARAQFNLGDTQALLDEARSLEREAEAAGDAWVVARARQQEALALTILGRWDEQVTLTQAVEGPLAALGESLMAAYLGVYRALAWIALEQEDRASEDLGRTIRQLAAVGDTRYLGAAETIFSESARVLGLPRMGVEYQREALAHHLADGNVALLASSQLALAGALGDVGDRAAASRFAAAARDNVARINDGPSRERTSALLDQVEAELAIQENPEHAIAKLDRFLATFGRYGDEYRRPESLIARSRAYSRLGDSSRATADLKAAIAVSVSLSESLREPLQAALVLDDARVALEDLVRLELGRDPSGLAAWRAVEHYRVVQASAALGLALPSVEPAAPRLPGDVCASTFFALPGELVSWTLCGLQPPRLIRTPVARDLLEATAREFASAGRRGDHSSLRQAAAQLEPWLGPTLESLPSTTRSWLVAADAALQPVSFAWLEFERRELFRGFEVAMTMAVSSLRAGAPPRALAEARPRWRGLALAPPSATPDGPGLLHAAEEALQISRALPEVEAAVGKAATFALLRSRVRGADLVHYAGHFAPSRRLSATGSLRFAADPRRLDGRASLAELAHLPAKNLRLVFLAACESASGSRALLSGALGPSEALLAAGADEVIGTLWPVSDEAQAEVSGEFYRLLAEGRSPARALAELRAGALDDQGKARGPAERNAVVFSLTRLTNHYPGRSEP